MHRLYHQIMTNYDLPKAFTILIIIFSISLHYTSARFTMDYMYKWYFPIMDRFVMLISGNRIEYNIFVKNALL